MKIKRISSATGETHEMDIAMTDLEHGAWVLSDALKPIIDRLFAHLTPDEATFLKTGMTREEFSERYPEQ